MKSGGYMSIIPRDPKYTSGGEYTYKYIATTTEAYILCAKTEAKSGYICTDQISGSGLSQVEEPPVDFGGWGGGSFTCGDTVTFTYKGSSVAYGTVEHNSKCWMDRNLGAAQAATLFNDSAAYGDLFQWGRLDDGHQTRNSGITTVLSGSSNPGHGNFIYGMGSPYDWVSPQIDSLWQGVSGTNNPCPSGWRVPTETEWNTERLSWSSNNYNGAFASPLKLTAAGYRDRSTATVNDAGVGGYYWSSAVSVPNSRILTFGSGGAPMYSDYRAYGFSVRCVKD
jgi:uncharacterized protein (TIGR02145 family)